MYCDGRYLHECAVVIQKTFRAYEGRKIYRQRLKVLHFLVSGNNTRVYAGVDFQFVCYLVSPSVGTFGGNEEELLLHHGREGRLEQAQ